MLWFALGLVCFSVFAGDRLTQQSSDPHFVLQAEAWLSRQISIPKHKVKGDDWVVLQDLTLHNNALAHGRRMATDFNSYQLTDGRTIHKKEIASLGARSYWMSFPPFPAAVMVVPALLQGGSANDVIVTVFIAALAMPLLLWLLIRIRNRFGHNVSPSGINDVRWLTIAFGLGSVFFFASVQGRVWFTAHVIGVVLTLCFLHACLGAKHPILAGLFLGCAALTRTPLAFLFPIFFFEWATSRFPHWSALSLRSRDLLVPHRPHRPESRPSWANLVMFCSVVASFAALGVWYNIERFGAPFEFGHRFLAVRQQQHMESLGLFDISYLRKNLRAAFALFPQMSTTKPYLQISGHGLAIWITSPYLLLLCTKFWRLERSTLVTIVAYVTTAVCIALPALLYQNTGWVQFGYRFGLDYLPLAIVVLFLTRSRLPRWALVLIVISIAINAFGALTFARFPQFYDVSHYSF